MASRPGGENPNAIRGSKRLKRAIKDLCQLTDEDLFAEVATGAEHVMVSVNGLMDAVRQLRRSGNHHAGRILEGLAAEEASKLLLLLDAVRCPPRKARERSRTLGYFYDHLAKGIYVAACDWRPMDFAHLRDHVDAERKSHYLDGPNDVDWIFPNSIIQGREDDLYVGFVQDITEVGGQGMRFWTPPRNDEALFTDSPDHVPDVVRIARGLFETKSTTPEGLALLAGIWRDVEVETMSCVQLGALNHRTLEELAGGGLLESASSKALDAVVNDWLFPLWPLDLSEDQVDMESLREERRHHWYKDT